jgi:IS30 family transposase
MHPMAKLTDDDVEQIRALSEQGMSIRQIARKMGISHTQVWRIIRYESR